MTAQGFLNQKQRHPIAMTAAISINAAAVIALMLAKTGVVPFDPDILTTYPVPAPTPTPDVVKPPESRTKEPTTNPVPHTPDPIVPHDPIEPSGGIEGTGDPVASGGTGEGARAEPRPEPTATPIPVITEPVPLPSAAREFQPPYPSQLLRMGVEGKVVVRVQIGVDGRVKQVAIISADDPLFAEATERQALRKWRFKPATRDGTAIESWKQMTVRFEIRT
jgi:periplasmic protein TonB